MISVSHSEYISALPFPNCIIDDFYDASMLDKVIEEWPYDMRYKSVSTSEKWSLDKIGMMGEKTQDVIYDLCSDSFCKELEKLTGIDNLVSDPEHIGGGIHMITHGGVLNIHADFNWNPRLQAVRKVNLLLYLNRNWNSNGELLLTDKNKNIYEKISPVFNRCVIFNTSDTSFHGHPEPLQSDTPRRSIALYYYQHAQKPEVTHSTVYI